MRVKLSPGFVSKAPLPETGDRVIYWDQERPGFGFMMTAAGHKSFLVQYRAGRRSRRMHLKNGLTLSEARKEAKAILGAVAKGGDPLAERRKAAASGADMLQSIAAEYLRIEAKGGRLRSLDQRQAVLQRLVYPRFGTIPISEIRRSDIVRLLDRIDEERGPVMADKTLAILRRLMSWHASRSDDFRSPIVRGMARTRPSDRAR